MSQCIEGFVFPIGEQHLQEYQRVADAVAAIYKEHGALEYVEFVGDDLNREGLRSFPEVISAKQGEVVVLGWIVFESPESRKLVNERIESDPRMEELVAPIVNPKRLIFDSSRMAYGGFRPLVNGSRSER